MTQRQARKMLRNHRTFLRNNDPRLKEFTTEEQYLLSLFPEIVNPDVSDEQKMKLYRMIVKYAKIVLLYINTMLDVSKEKFSIKLKPDAEIKKTATIESKTKLSRKIS